MGGETKAFIDKELSEQDILDKIYKEIENIKLSGWHHFPIGGHEIYFFSCPIGSWLRCALTSFTPELGEKIVLDLYDYDKKVSIFRKEFSVKNDKENEFVVKFLDLVRNWEQEHIRSRDYAVRRFLR